MNRIAELRKEKNYGQLKLGNLLGISQKTISSYENNISNLNIDTLIKLSEIFDTSIDYIVGNSNIKEPLNKILSKELSKEEKELLVLFRKLTYPNQLKALGMLSALSEIDK